MLRILIILIPLTLAGVTAPVADGTPPSDVSVRLASDESWEACATSLDLGRGPTLGQARNVCTCSSCRHSDAVDLGHATCWGASLAEIPGASWVWRPDVKKSSKPADLESVWLSKSFDLPGVPVRGVVSVAADDYAEIWVNGSVVGTVGSITDAAAAERAHHTLTSLDVTPHLVRGTNVIAVFAQNGPATFAEGKCDPCKYKKNPAGVVFGGVLSSAATTAATRSTFGSLKNRYR